MKYVPFTEEEKIAANSTDLVSFLQMRGERLVRAGREHKLIYSDASGTHDSIMIRGNLWRDYKNHVSGGAIKFMEHFYGMDFVTAVQELLGISVSKSRPILRVDESKPIEKKPFELPPRNKDMHRVFAYLIKQRFIDADVISHFAKSGTMYEDKDHHNVVFLGIDENGVPKQATKRSTSTYGKTFRITIESSDTNYSFAHFGESNRLFVFEAPIDMLSFISMHKKGWEKHSYIAMNGVYESAVLKALENHENLNRVYLCTDNDEGGIDAAYRLKDILNEHGYKDIYRVFPENKDFNEDLKALKGVDAKPSEPHRQMDAVMEIADDIAFFRCVPERLLSRLHATAKNSQYEYLAEYALSGSAYFLVNKHNEESERAMFEKLRSKLKNEYKPYSDKALLPTRRTQFDKQLKEVCRCIDQRARTREQEIKTAEMLYRLADSAVKLSAAIAVAEQPLQDNQNEDQQEDDSLDILSGYG